MKAAKTVMALLLVAGALALAYFSYSRTLAPPVNLTPASGGPPSGIRPPAMGGPPSRGNGKDRPTPPTGKAPPAGESDQKKGGDK
jgi:hypothetical protein